MNQRENLISLCRRTGYAFVPVEFMLCPALVQRCMQETGTTDYMDYFEMPWRNVDDIRLTKHDAAQTYGRWYEGLKPGTTFDVWGVAHEPGSEAAFHMTHMCHPLAGIESLEEIRQYPFPNFAHGDAGHQKAQVERIHQKGLAAVGVMQCTIWETAWYLRGMEDLMIDMMSDDPIAVYLLDEVTKRAIVRAQAFARAGVDIISLGDDIGMQHTVLMSTELYRTWIKPRLQQVVQAIRAIAPDTLVFYHSCGYVLPFIPDLIEVGIDVLNPLQNECMDYAQVQREFGNRISIHGTLGTQTLLPFGTPEQIEQEVFRNLDLAGPQGGLFVAPTHLLEPEVPWENILAYVNACKKYSLSRTK